MLTAFHPGDTKQELAPLLLLALPLVQDVAFNILFAGWETTASSLCFLLRELESNPKILQTLRTEQEQVQCLLGMTCYSVKCT